MIAGAAQQRCGRYPRCSRYQQASAGARVSRRPGLVIAGGLGAAAARPAWSPADDTPRACRSCWADAAFPIPAACRSLRSARHRRCDEPAMPGRRHAGRLGIAVIDHPAPLEAERRIDLAPLGAEIAVALLVLPTSSPNRQVHNWVPKVWPFHQVNSFRKNCFMSRAGSRTRCGSDAIGQAELSSKVMVAAPAAREG